MTFAERQTNDLQCTYSTGVPFPLRVCPRDMSRAMRQETDVTRIASS
jgi:hypothetical protein